MSGKSLSSARRDRHGRGVRHSLTGSLYRSGGSNQDQFRLIVASAVEYIKEHLPEELGNMTALILDAPIVGVNSRYVKRWSIRKESKTIILYRLPILRLDTSNNPNEERIRIEHHVFEAAAALIGKEPWELIFGDDES
jgi:hypothetical protein